MISLIACTIRDEMLENIFNNFYRQLWKEKELIIVLNNDQMNKEIWDKQAKMQKNIRVYKIPEHNTLGDSLNFGIEKSNYNIVAKIDDDDYYSPYYLTEAMKIFQTTNAQLVGKGKSFMYFEAEKLLQLRVLGNENMAGKSSLKGGTLIFRKEIYPKIKFPSRIGSGTDSSFVILCKKANIKFYCTSRYNYVYVRKTNSKLHTFKCSNKQLIRSSKYITKTTNYVPIITKKLGLII
ncbi:glycosyltransferase [Sutcliffiella halmapala]